MSTAATQYQRYQEGSVERAKRAKGSDVWVFRYRELQQDGTRVQRKKVIGDVQRYKNKTEAKKAIENFRAEINARQQRIGKKTVKDAWGHFQLKELRNPAAARSSETIQNYLDYFKLYIIPRWGNVLLEDVKTVAVEEWLQSLMSVEHPKKALAPATKTKIRNLMSSLYSHAIRHELYAPDFHGTKGNGTRQVFNPIAMVRTHSERQRDPDILTVDELRAIIERIEPQAIRVMVMVDSASALRRSELRGLKWRDCNFEKLWFDLRQGVVRKGIQTKLKTQASRRGLPMLPELAEVLRQWCAVTPYPEDDDWVFASPHTKGDRPYWPDSAMVDHIRPAALKAGIKKHITWHVFRHSLGNILKNNREDLKTIQEILRHANPRITAEVYLQGDVETKRLALNKVSGLLVVPPPAPSTAKSA